MTEEQWWYLQAQLSVQAALILALAKSDNNQSMLKQRFSLECEMIKTASLPLAVPDAFLLMAEKEIKRISESLWGKT